MPFSTPSRSFFAVLAAASVLVAACDNGHEPVQPADNTLPVLPEMSLTLAEDSSALLDVLSLASDEDGDSLRYGPVGEAQHGQRELTDAGIRYTPAPNFHGGDLIPVTVSDGRGGLAEGVIGVRVTPVNDAPSAEDDALRIDEDEVVEVDVLANDVDADGEPLQVTLLNEAQLGTATVVGGKVRYVPQANISGLDSLSYAIADPTNAADTARLSIEISAVNDPPVAEPDSAVTAEDEGVSIDVLANDSDVEDAELRVEPYAGGSHGELYQDLGKVMYIPHPDFHGVDSVQYIVFDQGGESATGHVTVTVTPVNDAPTAHADEFTVAEDATSRLDVTHNDEDIDGDALTLVSVTAPAHGTAAVDGDSLTYSAPLNFTGRDSLTYVIADPSGETATATVHLRFEPSNDAPQPADDSASVDEDGVVEIDVLANDQDPDGDFVDVVTWTSPTHGQVGRQGDHLRYAAPADENGSDSFTYTVRDPDGETATATVFLTINPVNDRPVANPDSAATQEDISVLIDVSGNDSDIEGDDLSVADWTSPPNGFVTLESGDLRYSPADDFHGTDRFAYFISDGELADSATVTVRVEPAGDAPVASSDQTSVAEDDSVTVHVLDNDTDVDGDSLFVSAALAGEHGAVQVGNGSVLYFPALDYNGPDSFRYVVSDGERVDTGTVSVTVTPVNDAPTTGLLSVSVLEDSSAYADVLSVAGDIDGDSLVIKSFRQPEHGSIERADALLEYRPDPDYAGPDAFTYTVADPFGATAEGTVEVSVQDMNDAPTAADDVIGTDEDVLVNFTPMANDEDSDGGTLAITGYTTPEHGEVSRSGDVFTYIPAPNFNGADSFTYTLDDSQGASSTGHVSITVQPVNDPPVAIADSSSLDEDASVQLDVLANDSDIDGDDLSVADITQPNHGTATVVGASIQYTPELNFYGADHFTYEVTDRNGESRVADVILTVASVNDGPTATPDTVSVDEDASVVLQPLANDTDPEGDPVTLDSVGTAFHGTVIRNGDDLSYTPNGDYYGDDAFSYFVSDSHGAPSTGSVVIAVNSINDPITVSADSVTIVEDSTALIDVLANDVDPEGEPLSIESVEDPLYGVASVESNQVRYVPDPHYNGEEVFAYVASAGMGSERNGTVVVTVEPVVDGPLAADDTVQVDEDVQVNIAVLANDVHPDGGTLDLISSTDPAHGTTTVYTSSISYRPDAEYSGPDSFYYIIEDGDGLQDTARVVIDVQAVNDPPIATGDSKTLNEDTEAYIDVLANDADPEGEQLSVYRFATDPASGTAEIVGDQILYTPNPNYYGEDYLAYVVRDAGGATDTAGVSLTIHNTFGQLTANPDSAVTAEDSVVYIDVLANDELSDDGGTLSLQSWTGADNALVARSDFDDNDLRVYPDIDWNGTTSFTYTVVDGLGNSDTATVVVEFTPVEDAPEAVDDSVAIDQGETNSATIRVLSNDVDADGDALSISTYDGGDALSHGSLSRTGDAFVFEADTSYEGVTSFTYTVTDGKATSQATVTITVLPPNEPPVADDDTELVPMNSTATLLVLTNDHDPNGDPLEIVSFTQPVDGLLVRIDPQTFEYTPEVDWLGTVTFEYTVADGRGGSDTASVELTVRDMDNPR